MNPNKNTFKTLLVTAVYEILLTALLSVVIIIFIGYVQVNFVLYSYLKLTTFAMGWEKLWIFLYFLSDILFMEILFLIFLEVVLFVLRQIFIRAIKAVEKIKNQSFTKTIDWIKKISLISVFKFMRINTPKRSIIAYLIVMAFVFGSGWISKSVLKAYDSPVYRAHEIINLYSNETIETFTDEISDDQRWDLSILAGVANVHLYSVTNSNEAKFYYLYDTEVQLASYSLVIDRNNDTIHIVCHEEATTYERYVDPVLPSLEIYLPGSLKINNVIIEITAYGGLTMEYVAFTNLDVTTKNADVSIKAENLMVNTIDIHQKTGALTLLADDALNVELDLDEVRASIRLKKIRDALTISAKNNTTIFMYQTLSEFLNIHAMDSSIELREVFATQILIDLNTSKLIFVNSSGASETLATITQENSTITLRGVKDDSESE